MIILVTYEITYTGGYWNLTAWAVYLVQLHRLDCYTNQLDCYKVNKNTDFFSYFMLLLNFSSNAFYFILFDNLQAFFGSICCPTHSDENCHYTYTRLVLCL